jgi:hypothetical protein
VGKPHGKNDVNGHSHLLQACSWLIGTWTWREHDELRPLFDDSPVKQTYGTAGLCKVERATLIRGQRNEKRTVRR